jgi:hypothetical protein
MTVYEVQAWIGLSLLNLIVRWLANIAGALTVQVPNGLENSLSGIFKDAGNDWRIRWVTILVIIGISWWVRR